MQLELGAYPEEDAAYGAKNHPSTTFPEQEGGGDGGAGGVGVGGGGGGAGGLQSQYSAGQFPAAQFVTHQSSVTTGLTA